MSNDLEALYNEAVALFKEKDYTSARELLEVLVSSDYKPAYKMLLVIYKQLNETDLEQELIGKIKVNEFNSEKKVNPNTNNLNNKEAEKEKNKNGDVFVYPTQEPKKDIHYDNGQPTNYIPQKNTSESEKIWDWGEIIFLLTIIFSFGILTPIAFLYRRIFRGFSILVKNAEKNLNN